MKELGILVTDCPCLASDVQKIFNVYWHMGGPKASLPPAWPPAFDTHFNAANPLRTRLNNSAGEANYDVFFSVPSPLMVHLSGTGAVIACQSAPDGFTPPHREKDAAAIVSAIAAARSYVHVAVMAYGPADPYSKPPRFPCLLSPQAQL